LNIFDCTYFVEHISLNMDFPLDGVIAVVKTAELLAAPSHHLPLGQS
jgi:hypothetical protein